MKQTKELHFCLTSAATLLTAATSTLRSSFSSLETRETFSEVFKAGFVVEVGNGKVTFVVNCADSSCLSGVDDAWGSIRKGTNKEKNTHGTEILEQSMH